MPGGDGADRSELQSVHLSHIFQTAGDHNDMAMGIRIQIMVIIGVVFAILIATIGVLESKLNRTRENYAGALDLAKHHSDSSTFYKNELGRETARNHAMQITQNNLHELIKTKELAWITQFAGVNKKVSNVEAALQVNAAALASLSLSVGDTTTVVHGDTTKAKKWGYRDEFNFIHGTLIGDTTALITARIRTPLQGVIYQGKRTKKFLFIRYGPREVLTELASPNPWVKIENLEYIKIQKR